MRSFTVSREEEGEEEGEEEEGRGLNSDPGLESSDLAIQVIVRSS
jgi:hypothetical protein